MPKITISNQGQKVVNIKLNNENHQSVLATLQDNYIDWIHACDGKGRCTTYRFSILQGNHNLAHPTNAENEFLCAGKILPAQRMVCQVVLLGNIKIEVPEKYKLPSVNYTN